MALKTDYANATPSADQHPAAHNTTNTKVNELDTAVTANTAAIATNATALARLPKGQLAAVAFTGTFTNTTPLVVTSPSLTINGRRISVTVALFAVASANTGPTAAVAAPGVSVTQRLAFNLGTTQGLFAMGPYRGSATGNGTVTVTLTNSGPQTTTADVGSVVYVDDLGAV
jgi:hypothetical protein